jgi:hypothetical protein
MKLPAAIFYARRSADWPPGVLPINDRYVHYAIGGASFQISRLYSAMVRSVEKNPDDAVFRILIRVQLAWSCQAIDTLCWAST